MEVKHKEDVVIVLDLDLLDGGCGVYKDLNEAMDFIANWEADANFTSTEAFRNADVEHGSDALFDAYQAEIKAAMVTIEILEGWIVEYKARSHKVVRSTYRGQKPQKVTICSTFDGHPWLVVKGGVDDAIKAVCEMDGVKLISKVLRTGDDGLDFQLGYDWWFVKLEEEGGDEGHSDNVFYTL